jgi:hypothetical protein
MPASRAQRAITAERRAQLIRLRLEGVAYDDDRILRLGYSSSRSASKDFIRALEERRDEQAAAASVYRQQENERLDALLEAVWPAATTPSPIYAKDGTYIGEAVDMKAVDTVLKLMDRRAKLNGLDMPVKAEVSGPDGGPLQMGPATSAELEALIGLGRGSPTATTQSDDESHRDVEDEDSDA